jgi:outer membrane receptor protein involved in Fe transport
MEAFNLLLHTTTLDLLAHHQLGSHISGTAGVTGFLQSNDTRGPIPLVPDADGSGGAAYIWEEYRKEKFSLLGGARVDTRSLTAKANEDLGLDADEDRDWTEASGDAGIVIRPGVDWAIAANVGRSFRAPTLFELYANGPQIAEARYLRGDSDLDAERGLNLDGGIRFEASRFHGDVSVFMNQIDEFIALYPTGETVGTLPEYAYRATDAVLTGVEAGLELQAAGPLVLSGEFDAVRAEDDETDEPLPLIPAVRGIVGAGAVWNHLNWAEHFAAKVDVTIVGDKTRLAANETATDGYVLVGGELDLVERLAGREWDFSVAVRNAANTTYRDFLSRYKAFADNAGTDVTFRLGTTF